MYLAIYVRIFTKFAEVFTSPNCFLTCYKFPPAHTVGILASYIVGLDIGTFYILGIFVQTYCLTNHDSPFQYIQGTSAVWYIAVAVDLLIF